MSWTTDDYGNALWVDGPIDITAPAAWPNTGAATATDPSWFPKFVITTDDNGNPLSTPPSTGASNQTSAAPPSDASSWVNNALSIGKQFLALKQVNDLTDVNVQRAKQGLPPVAMNAIAPTVNVGLSPQIQSLLLYAGLGLLGYGFLKKSKRR